MSATEQTVPSGVVPSQAVPDEHDGYRGPATLVAGDVSVECDVVITGHFEPVPGRFKWYGRASGQGLDALPAKGSRLRTPHGSAETTVNDVDLWGRYRLQGFGTPPFPVPGHDSPIPGQRDPDPAD